MGSIFARVNLAGGSQSIDSSLMASISSSSEIKSIFKEMIKYIQRIYYPVRCVCALKIFFIKDLELQIELMEFVENVLSCKLGKACSQS